jgi:hypothetical protein
MTTSARTWTLAAIALLVGAALLWENRTGRKAHAPQGGSEAPSRGQIAVLRQKLAEADDLRSHKGEIVAAYQRLAPGYVEIAARLVALVAAGDDPRQTAEKAIRGAMEGAEIKSLLMGDPEVLGEGVYRLSVTIQLDTGFTEPLLRALWWLGHPDHGAAWEELSLIVDPKEGKVSLTGRLSLLAIEAPE